MECVRGHSHMLHGIFSATGHVTSICKIRAAPLQAELHLVVLSVAGFGLPQRGPRVHFVLDRAVQARHIFCYKVGPASRKHGGFATCSSGRLCRKGKHLQTNMHSRTISLTMYM